MDNSADWIFPKDFIVNPRGDNADGKLTQEERDKRSKTIWFMEDMSRELNMDRRVLYTASVYFHRFFLFHSFKDQNRFFVALACLFLAGKVEEKAYKLKELIHCYFVLRFRSKPSEEDFRDAFKNVILAERVILSTLNFDLNLNHPYNIFVSKMRELRSYVPEDSRKSLMQTAVNFLNDSYRGTFCLEYTPTEIAFAVFYLATITLAVRPINPNPRSLVEVTWVSVLLDQHIREYRLRCLCLEILNMYEELAYLLQEGEDVERRLERRKVTNQLVAEMGGIVPSHMADRMGLSSVAVIEDDQTTLDAMTPREKSMSFASLGNDHHVHSSSGIVHSQAIEASFAIPSSFADVDGSGGLLSHVLLSTSHDEQHGAGRKPTVTVTKVSGHLSSGIIGSTVLANQTPASVVGMDDINHHSHNGIHQRGDLSTTSFVTTASVEESYYYSGPQRGASGGASDDTPVHHRFPHHQNQQSFCNQLPPDTPTFSDLAVNTSGGSGLGSNGGSAIKSGRARSRSNSISSEQSESAKRVRVE